MSLPLEMLELPPLFYQKLDKFGEGHEPFKLYYKKFPGHEKGSVFWNYEINTAGEDNLVDGISLLLFGGMTWP